MGSSKKKSESEGVEVPEEGDDGTNRAAKKGRKTALKATRRIARVLGVKINEGEDSDESAGEAEPFQGFPSRKAARKLSGGERELLVRQRGGQEGREGGRREGRGESGRGREKVCSRLLRRLVRCVMLWYVVCCIVYCV